MIFNMYQYSRFDCHHTLEHKQVVIRTLQHRANDILANMPGTEAEEHCIKTALGKCGIPSWTFDQLGSHLKNT